MKKLPLFLLHILMRMLPKALLAVVVAGISFAHAGAGGAGSPQAEPEQQLRQDLYGGLVTNQTITVAGQDFYQHFVAAWRQRELSESFAISIHERPSARWGSKVWIEYGQRRVFHASLPTARAAIKSLSEHAVAIAQQQIIDTEVERLLFRNADLGADEI
jgi:curli production assembly/transport component CsgE